jgi:regulator of protease activity HflC (stomatin/prohibitin superfamily)
MTAVFVALIIIAAVVVAVAGASVRILREYERAVVFRLGRLLGQKGPGIVLLIPGIDRMVRVDLRTVTFDVPPQDLITRDNVPAKVNAVTYFRVVDPVKSVIEVERYRAATSQIAQTTLRSVLGKADLDMLLSERERLNEALQQIIDEQTDPWGIKVTTVEIKDVGIPQGMQRAMARQAEAERERRAKVINAEGEFQASERLYDAAQIMSANPTALQLRYLQTLLELGSSQASTIVFPLPIDLLKPLVEATKLDGTERRPPPIPDRDAADRTLEAADGARELADSSAEEGEIGAVEAQVERTKANVERVEADLAEDGARPPPGSGRRRDADEAQRLGPERLEAVQLAARDVDDVARADLVDVVAERHTRAPALDHDAVVVRVALARRAPAGGHVEVAHAVVRRAVGRADELVLLDAGQPRVVVTLRGDALPGML